MGVETAGRTLAACLAQHTRLLQHKVLPVEDGERAPEALVLAHHETLEKVERHEIWPATTDCSTQILSTSFKGSN